jgi:hypothetical protein
MVASIFRWKEKLLAMSWLLKSYKQYPPSIFLFPFGFLDVTYLLEPQKTQTHIYESHTFKALEISMFPFTSINPC